MRFALPLFLTARRSTNFKLEFIDFHGVFVILFYILPTAEKCSAGGIIAISIIYIFRNGE